MKTPRASVAGMGIFYEWRTQKFPENVSGAVGENHAAPLNTVHLDMK